MVSKKKRNARPKSIKDSGGMRSQKLVEASSNLGKLMRKYRKVEDVLFTYTVNSDMVYEDMDFSIEEFSDMTGCDLEELMDEILEAVKSH